MRLARLGVAIVCAALLAGCAGAPRAPRPAAGTQWMKPIAKPGDVVAVELAFARAAGELGRWAAFRQYAADTGVMFVPEMVNAPTWLKRRAEPAMPLAWEPYEVWSSCDGSIGVTRGGWQSGAKKGWFTTVWKRQQDGSYRWLLNHRDEDAGTLPPPEMIEAHIAACPKPDWQAPIALAEIVSGNGAFFGGASDDGSLRWAGRVDDWGGRIVTVDVFDGTDFQRVLHQTVAPPVRD